MSARWRKWGCLSICARYDLNEKQFVNKQNEINTVSCSPHHFLIILMKLSTYQSLPQARRLKKKVPKRRCSGFSENDIPILFLHDEYSLFNIIFFIYRSGVLLMVRCRFDKGLGFIGHTYFYSPYLFLTRASAFPLFRAYSIEENSFP